MAPTRRASTAAPSAKRAPPPAAAPSPSSSTSSTSSSAASSDAHGAAPHFEFGGPFLGPLGILAGLPLLVMLFALFCGGGAGKWPGAAELVALVPRDVGAARAALEALRSGVLKALSAEAFLAYTAYFLVHVLLALVVPGPRRLGAPLPGAAGGGARLAYTLNGFRCLVLVVAGMLAVELLQPFGADASRAQPGAGVPRPALLGFVFGDGTRIARFGIEWILENYAQLTLASVVFSSLLSAWLYAYSFLPAGRGTFVGVENGAKVLAPGGDTGVALYDFFIGRELNPRLLWGALDLKFHCELRPGLAMWLLINLAAAFRQLRLHGAVDAWLGSVLLFEGLYVVDSVWNEEAILTTMDITTDGFGFMLAFGDLAWVPAVYSLQARFLADQPLSPVVGEGAAGAAGLAKLVAVWALAALGMWVFRGANSQKDAFKRDPDAPEFRGMRTIATARGTRLLADGWWGVARHVNYLGDWLMSVAWSLPTGAASPVTYFYPLYFAVLLVHRDLRDGEKCAKKYGKSWDQFCAAVPWRIVPRVY